MYFPNDILAFHKTNSNCIVAEFINEDEGTIARIAPVTVRKNGFGRFDRNAANIIQPELAYFMDFLHSLYIQFGLQGCDLCFYPVDPVL